MQMWNDPFVQQAPYSVLQRPGFWTFYFSPTGRVSRGQYWRQFLLPFGLLGIVLIAALIACVWYAWHGRISFIVVVALLGVLLVKAMLLTWISFAMHIKRYHDLNMAWGSVFMIDNFMPFGSDWMLWRILFENGTPGDNQFGPDPRQFD